MAFVTWPSLGVDRAAAITPEDDNYVELKAGADGGPLWMVSVTAESSVLSCLREASVDFDRDPVVTNSQASAEAKRLSALGGETSASQDAGGVRHIRAVCGGAGGWTGF